jgi:hypothetical protein
MDAIELKTLSEAHSISSKLEHQKKCLLNAENGLRKAYYC